MKAKWSKRELAHEIKTAAFERTVLSDKKLAALPRLLPQDATGIFKDSYLPDFLDLPQRHSEVDLQTSLLRNLRKFLMERRRKRHRMSLPRYPKYKDIHS
jgi:predicted nuclease of restriction endonuclease-like (RecB) superfamily